MAADFLDDYIEAVATALALPVEAAWKPAVKANLEVSLRLAGLVDEFLLPDETEPAVVGSFDCGSHFPIFCAATAQTKIPTINANQMNPVLLCCRSRCFNRSLK